MGRRLGVTAACLLASSACSGRTATVHPVGLVVVGVLHTDGATRCSWIQLPGGGVVETIWTDGTVVDGSAPGGHGLDTLTLTVDNETVAHSGDEIQALVDPSASVRPVPGCPVPSGSKVIAVQQVRVRPSSPG